MGQAYRNGKNSIGMIEDCKAGKIDLILTKSISRFARNYVDCGQIVRELMDLNPPVGVRFESENLFTLKMQGEMQLMMFSGITQEESRIKSNAKYGGRGILPELNIITEGALQGYVAVNPRWAGFEAEDYQKASLRTCGPPIDLELVRIEIQPGDFDLRGFDVVRAQFFQTVHTPCITFSIKGIHFNCVCIHKLGGTKFVELLVHPGKRMFAVRPAEENGRHSLSWARLVENGNWMSKTVSGAAFLPTLYQLLGWKTEYKYCMKAYAATNICGDWGLMVPAKPPSGGSDRNFIASKTIAEGIQNLIPQVRRKGAEEGG